MSSEAVVESDLQPTSTPLLPPVSRRSDSKRSHSLATDDASSHSDDDSDEAGAGDSAEIGAVEAVETGAADAVVEEKFSGSSGNGEGLDAKKKNNKNKNQNKNQKTKHVGVMATPLAAALLYAVCSASMNFANKAVFVGFSFQTTTLLLQMVFTVAVLRTLRACGKVTFEDYNSDLGKKLAMPSLMYCVNIVCSLMSLGSLSIPVYQVLKRMTPVACLILAYFVLNKKPSLHVVGCIGLIAVGTIVMGLGDIVFDPSGYALGIGSVLSQSLYLTYVQKQGIKMDMLTILYVNSINCLPILVIIMVSIGEYSRLLTYDGWDDPTLYGSISALLVVGGLLNYAMFLCTVVNSAVLTTVVGVIKAVFTTVIGFYTFGGQPLTPLLIVGITLNTIGAIVYSVIKFLDKRRVTSAERLKQLQAETDELERLEKESWKVPKTHKKKKKKKKKRNKKSVPEDSD